MLDSQQFKSYNARSIRETPYWRGLPDEIQEAITIVSHVMPFRTNEYVMRELVDWGNVPDDPIFRMTFPHRDMLPEEEYTELRELTRKVDGPGLSKRVELIRRRMNPHPAGQMTHNVPMLDGKHVSGIQHKYRETVLFFPSAGQTCHAYCTFCFRWPQFVGMAELKFDARDSTDLVAYLKQHKEVTDVLITGGDPLIMSARALSGYLDPLLTPELEHIQNIRIGTKSVSYWPQRFVTDKDADDLLRLFGRVISAGKNLAIMGHYDHPVELRPEIAQRAVKRILSSGATLRMQAPLLRHINEDPRAWAELWTTGVRLGAIPYYMFVERDTGPSQYFRLPLVRAYEIFKAAYQMVSGLSRTVRGPSMSAFPGKVVIDGVVTVGDKKLFALQFLQARDPDLVRRPFFARFDPDAVWFDDLTPAPGDERFFLEAKQVPPRQQETLLQVRRSRAAAPSPV
jgi:KamA family protein